MMCIKLLAQRYDLQKSVSVVHQGTFSAATASHDHYNSWGGLLDNSRCLDAQGIAAIVLSCMSQSPLIPCVYLFSKN